VEDASSALDYALQEKDFIYANHVDMCRFSGFDDDGYRKIKAALSHCLSIDIHADMQSTLPRSAALMVPLNTLHRS
jgi:hypothetical protein